MNFEQAREHSFKVPWKTIECFSGPQCWCRRIIPADAIMYNVGTETEEYEVVPYGAIDQKTAEYIVGLHNKMIEERK